MEPTDNRTQADMLALALAAGLDRAATLFPEEIERALAMLAEQRRMLGAIDDPAVRPASPQRGAE